jgi:hypothetical protein
MFGVGPNAEQVYRALLRRSRVSLEDLSSLVGRPVTEVAREVDRLAEVRLVRVVDDLIYAEPPDLTLGRLVSEHEERIRAEEQALSRVRLSIPQYVLDHESRQVAWDPILIDAVETPDLVATLETLLHNSEGTLRFMRPDQFNLAQGVHFDDLVLRALVPVEPPGSSIPKGSGTTCRSWWWRAARPGSRCACFPSYPCGWRSSEPAQQS